MNVVLVPGPHVAVDLRAADDLAVLDGPALTTVAPGILSVTVFDPVKSFSAGSAVVSRPERSRKLLGLRRAIICPISAVLRACSKPAWSTVGIVVRIVAPGITVLVRVPATAAGSDEAPWPLEPPRMTLM
jgi:hypothetical protein